MPATRREFLGTLTAAAAASVPAMKYALSLRGLRESGYRIPFIPLNDEQKRALAAKLGS